MSTWLMMVQLVLGVAWFHEYKYCGAANLFRFGVYSALIVGAHSLQKSPMELVICECTRNVLGNMSHALQRGIES